MCVFYYNFGVSEFIITLALVFVWMVHDNLGIGVCIDGDGFIILLQLWF